MLHDADDPSPYEMCVAALDEHAKQLGRNVITHDEYEAKAYAALSEYFEADRPEDDIALLLQYARLPIETILLDPLAGDRAALDVFDRQLQGLLHYPASKVTLADTLEDITERIAAGDPEAVEELCALCREGWRELPHVFMFRSNVDTALRAAADLGVVEALVEAVSPTVNQPGQLGGHDGFGGYGRRLVFDLLGMLATGQQETAVAALDALVELCGYLDTAASAAVRLPVYRLSGDHRVRLHEHLEAAAELLASDPFLAPTHDGDRVPHILRSVLWLANDATRVG